MDFLRKFFGLAEHPHPALSPTVIVPGAAGSGERLRVMPSPAPAPQAREASPSPASVDDEYLEGRFLDFLGQSPPFAAIHFEPEEECCFIYYYRDDGMRKVDFLQPDTWDKKVEQLKSLDFTEITLSSGRFIVSLIISFSNFGERISVILEPVSSDAGERIRNSKKSCIRLLNTLKPATSLTELNRVQLARFVETHRASRGPGLVESLVEEGLVGPGLLEECGRLSRERSAPVESLLIERGVFPRKLLTRLVADWAGFPYVDIDEEERDPRAARMLGEEFCRSGHLLPFRMDDAEISVAFAYPGDEERVREIESRAARKIVVMMSAAEDIRNRVVELFRRPAEQD